MKENLSPSNPMETTDLTTLPVREQKQSLLKTLRENPALLQQGAALMSQATAVWQQNQQMSYELAHRQLETQAQIYAMTQRYALMRDTLTAVFGERHQALSAHYQVLQRGLEQDDNELLLAAMRGISDIVTTNPLERFQEFKAQLSDPTAVLELDF